ncbi:AMP-binding protein [Zavarzinia sp. CC-PAN008]|uniref:AMP-binding protein n=1 Tax=Zavarzinia sp. CC-PAN008 TaxID=3243332 RepID=UPI003F747BA8
MATRAAPVFDDLQHASRDALAAEQLHRLKWSVRHAHENVSHFRAACAARGVAPGDLKQLSDLALFPFARKGDFREHYPFGMFAVPQDRVARIHASSGTTGKPTIVGYTQGDLDRWADLVARSLLAAGARPGDVLHNAYGYGLFTGGLGLHDGGQKAGLAVVPASGGQTERQVQLIVDLKPRVIACTPSYMLVLAEALERAGVDPRATALRIGIHGAEPWSDEMRREIEARMGTAALDIYGLSEVMGPGVAMERVDARGALTLWEDHFYPEIVSPETGEPVPDGTRGELVLTTLTKEAVPLIRYRTGDLSTLLPAVEGSPMRRLERLLGRTDDMLIVRGVNLFPRQIEELILDHPALAPHYRIDVRRDGPMDHLSITVEALAGVDDDACAGARAVLGHRIKDRLGLSAEVVIAVAGAVARSEGKARRVFDHRPR